MDRDQTIAALYAGGLTLAQIGERYGLTRERVRQICRAMGIGRPDGGAHKRKSLRRQELTAQRNARCLKKWGCDWDQYVKMRGTWAMMAYRTQRNSALGTRGIGWELNFWQWWTIWQESGHWDERGRTGYVMCRRGDIGPYAVGNVYIATAQENSSKCHRLDKAA